MKQNQDSFYYHAAFNNNTNYILITLGNNWNEGMSLQCIITQFAELFLFSLLWGNSFLLWNIFKRRKGFSCVFQRYAWFVCLVTSVQKTYLIYQLRLFFLKQYLFYCVPCVSSIYKHMHYMSPWQHQSVLIERFLHFHGDTLHMTISNNFVT